ncbi:MAG: cardiolipin synthase [Sarcina sp.]
MRKILKFLFNRIAIVGFLILLQLFVLMYAIWELSESFIYLYVFFIALSIIVVIYIVSRNDNPSFKLAWTIPVLTVPVFGGLFYLIFGGNKTSKRFKRKIEQAYKKHESLLQDNTSIISSVALEDKIAANQMRYIDEFAKYPPYEKTKTEYLNIGEVFFEKLLEELKKAEKYIFLEYFIITAGYMWDEILKILELKVAEGVEVRVMYDDMGCLRTLPYKYDELLRSKGIKCVVFNPFLPLLSLRMNNRDHRKIAIIDGHTGFTGGINLADEYINKTVKFGHWKDSAIYLKGEAVWSLTLMFLQAWNFDNPDAEDYTVFKPYIHLHEDIKSDGIIQPYGDSPLDGEIVGENVYLNIINKATDYIYITTPYLIVDNELVTALILAAKNGVDVRVITPHMQDKWYAHIMTRSYYNYLIDGGVKIYEYTPGFMHAKNFVADDKIATVGTINMDYRSLYLHFECGVFLYKNSSIKDIKSDFIETMNKSQMITLDECNKVKWSNRIVRSIMRVFAPLL